MFCISCFRSPWLYFTWYHITFVKILARCGGCIFEGSEGYTTHRDSMGLERGQKAHGAGVVASWCVHLLLWSCCSLYSFFLHCLLVIIALIAWSLWWSLGRGWRHGAWMRLGHRCSWGRRQWAAASSLQRKRTVVNADQKCWRLLCISLEWLGSNKCRQAFPTNTVFQITFVIW